MKPFFHLSFFLCVLSNFVDGKSFLLLLQPSPTHPPHCQSRQWLSGLLALATTVRGPAENVGTVEIYELSLLIYRQQGCYQVFISEGAVFTLLASFLKHQILGGLKSSENRKYCPNIARIEYETSRKGSSLLHVVRCSNLIPITLLGSGSEWQK